MGKANVAIACIGTILGFATSAVVAEVRGRSAEPVRVAEKRVQTQFRPAFALARATFVSTPAPGWRTGPAPAADLAMTRSIVVSNRTVGVAR